MEAKVNNKQIGDTIQPKATNPIPAQRFQSAFVVSTFEGNKQQYAAPGNI